MHVGCSGGLYYYFMKEVTPSAKAGINEEPWGSVIITMAKFYKACIYKQSRGGTASQANAPYT